MVLDKPCCVSQTRYGAGMTQYRDILSNLDSQYIRGNFEYISLYNRIYILKLFYRQNHDIRSHLTTPPSRRYSVIHHGKVIRVRTEPKGKPVRSRRGPATVSGNETPCAIVPTG